MDTTDENLLRLNRSHIGPASETLVRAFHDYPLLKHCFPGEQERGKIAPYFFRYALYYSVRYGEVYAASPDLEGVAGWIPSDNYPVTFLKSIRSVPLSVIIGFGREGGSRMKHPGDYMDAVHERLAPFKHWFLQVIGVDPQFQGKGYAGKLLRPMLARVDGEGLPCYLETLEEKNVRLYEHFGFKMIEKSAIPETGLTNWAMLREAR
jgi:ribosomal protein S18 acetylase RimI-like enzyme